MSHDFYGHCACAAELHFGRSRNAGLPLAGTTLLFFIDCEFGSQHVEQFWVQKKKKSNKNQRTKETPQHLRSAYAGNGPAKYASAECTKRKDPAPSRGMTRDHDNYEGAGAGRVPLCGLAWFGTTKKAGCSWPCTFLHAS